MKGFFKLTCLLLFISVFCTGFIWQQGTESHGEWDLVELTNCRAVKNERFDYDIILSEEKYKIYDRELEFLLTFDNNDPSKLSDSADNYKIIESDYVFSKDVCKFGGGAAGFFKPSHKILMHTPSSLLLGDVKDMGSFTMEFWIYLNKISENTEIISKIGYFPPEYADSEYSGFRVSISKRKMYYVNNNLNIACFFT